MIPKLLYQSFRLQVHFPSLYILIAYVRTVRRPQATRVSLLVLMRKPGFCAHE